MSHQTQLFKISREVEALEKTATKESFKLSPQQYKKLDAAWDKVTKAHGTTRGSDPYATETAKFRDDKDPFVKLVMDVIGPTQGYYREVGLNYDTGKYVASWTITVYISRANDELDNMKVTFIAI